MTANHDQQRTSQRHGGEPCGACAGYSLAAREDVQGGRCSLPVDVPTFLRKSRSSLLRAQLGRGVVPGPFPIQFARHAPLCGLSVRRPDWTLPAGRAVAVNLRCAFASRSSSVPFDNGHHVCQDKSDVPHRHSSTSAPSHEQTHRAESLEPCSRNRGKRYPR